MRDALARLNPLPRLERADLNGGGVAFDAVALQAADACLVERGLREADVAVGLGGAGGVGRRLFGVAELGDRQFRLGGRALDLDELAGRDAEPVEGSRPR